MENFWNSTFSSPALPEEKLCGEILKFRYRSDRGDFAIALLKDSSGDEQTVCGPLTGVEPGQKVELTGRFTDHPEFGHQFKASSCRAVPPESKEGLVRFLSNAVPGLGPKNAAAIVEFFKEETLEVLNKFPKRLKEVPGIGAKRASDISRVWKENASQRETLIFMQGLGITPAYCARVLKRYGEKASEVLQKNPYQLADEVDGIGFLKADSIARALNIASDSPERLCAGAVFAMNTLVTYGHVCAPEENLRRSAAELLKQSEEAAAAGIRNALEKGLLRRENGMIYTPVLLQAERALPAKVAQLAAQKKFAGQNLPDLAPEIAAKLAPEQRLAVESVRRSPLSIVTGGPGVGKTTVVGTIVKSAESARLQIALAAPTGRAAKRLAESSGMEAKTIHRLLGYDPRKNGFEFNESEPLECQLLIVDEISMLDLPLASALFAAIPKGCSVVLVGDADQLPSVGPGTVLADLLESGFFAVTRLTRVFRQAAESSIVSNAHRVLQGQLPMESPNRNGALKDFYIIDPSSPQRAAELVETLVTARIPERFHLDPVRDIQVLTPMNRGDAGAGRLNSLLEKKLSLPESPSFRLGERVFRTGDKVMQRSNNYDKNVFNGDTGIITAVNEKSKIFLCSFDNGTREVEYSFDEADQLTHAYAITVHKSQGGEYPAVVLVLLTQHFLMLRRNLLYTAMTRAKKLLIIIGDRKSMEIALSNNRKERRFSCLAERFRNFRSR